MGSTGTERYAELHLCIPPQYCSVLMFETAQGQGDSTRAQTGDAGFSVYGIWPPLPCVSVTPMSSTACRQKHSVSPLQLVNPPVTPSGGLPSIAMLSSRSSSTCPLSAAHSTRLHHKMYRLVGSTALQRGVGPSSAVQSTATVHRGTICIPQTAGHPRPTILHVAAR